MLEDSPRFIAKLNPLTGGSNSNPLELPQGVENTSTPKPARSVYSSLVHNCRHLEASCPSVGERVNQLQFIQTTDYYSVKKE